MATPHLNTMPTEIILQIVQNLQFHSKYDTCLVNKRFHAITNPKLYTSAVAAEHPGITVLAAKNGNLDTLRLAASFGADLNRVYWVPIPVWARSEEARHQKHADTGFGISWATPLHVAAAEGHYDTVKWLLSQGVDLDVPGKLLCGCRSASERYMFTDHQLTWHKELETAGIWTPLHLAICRGKQSVARFLIHHGASMNIRYRPHNSILETHAVRDLFSTCSSEVRVHHFGRNVDKGEGESDEDSESNSENNESDNEDQHFGDNMLAIHTAAASGQTAIVRLLHALDVDINSPDGAGATAAFYALDSPNLDMLRYCLALGADSATLVNMENHLGVMDDIENLAEYAVEVFYHRPAFICSVFRCLAGQRGFWRIGDKYSSSSSICNTIDRLVSRMHHSRDEISFREEHAWIAGLFHGGIATFDSANKVEHLAQDIYNFFWVALTKPRYRVEVLNIIANEFYLFILNDEVDLTTSFIQVYGIDCSGEHGTFALRWLLEQDSIESDEDYYVPTRTLEKLTWLLEQGADPVGGSQGSPESPVLRTYLDQLRQRLTEHAEYGRLRTWDVTPFINLLGKHGGWGRSAGDIQKTLHSYRELLRGLHECEYWLQIKQLDKVTLPDEVSE